MTRIDEKLKELVNQVFSKDGWLVQQGFSHRPEQESYANDVAQWLLSGSSQHSPKEICLDSVIRNVGIIESDTGTGKTIGYLIPLMLFQSFHDQPVIVSTYTLALQKQLLGKDLETVVSCLGDLIGRAPKIARKVGRRQFVSPERFQLRQEEMFEFCEPDESWWRFSEWLDSSMISGTAMFEEWYEEYNLDLPYGLSRESICVLGSDEYHEAIERMNADVRHADLIITSHASLIANIVNHGELLNSRNRTPLAIVVDEADKVIHTAESYFQKRLQIAEIVKRVEEIKTKSKVKKETITLLNNLDTLLKQSDPIDKDVLVLKSEPNELVSGKVEQNCQLLSHNLFVLSQSKFHKSDLKAKEMSEVSNYVTTFLTDIQQEGKQNDIRAVSYSNKRRIPSLMSYRPNAAGILNYYAKRNVSLLFTSATLSDSQNDRPASFLNFKVDLRLSPSKIVFEKEYAPKSFGRLEFEVPPLGTPMPFVKKNVEERNSEADFEYSLEWLEFVRNSILRAACDGKTLVLAPSFSECQHVSDLLSDSFDVITSRPGESVTSIVKKFQEGGQILITPSIWEGVSIRDRQGSQLFTQLVMTRIPFLPPSKALLDVFVYSYRKAKPEVSNQQAERVFQYINAVNAVIKARQGVGRLIRNSNDQGKIWFCDPRMPRDLESGDKFKNILQRIIPKRFLSEYLEACRKPAPVSLIKEIAA